ARPGPGEIALDLLFPDRELRRVWPGRPAGLVCPLRRRSLADQSARGGVRQGHAGNPPAHGARVPRAHQPDHPHHRSRGCRCGARERHPVMEMLMRIPTFRLLALAVVPVLALGSPAALHAQRATPPPVAPPEDLKLPEKREFTLPNGMAVTLVPY